MDIINLSGDPLILKPIIETICVYPYYSGYIALNLIIAFFIRINHKLNLSGKLSQNCSESWKQYFQKDRLNAELMGDLFFINLIVFIFQFGAMIIK